MGDISEKGGRIHVKTELWLSSAFLTDMLIIYIIKSHLTAFLPSWGSRILEPSAFVGKITVLFAFMNRQKSTVKINN